jgi:hypothetical protein
MFFYSDTELFSQEILRKRKKMVVEMDHVVSLWQSWNGASTYSDFFW